MHSHKSDTSIRWNRRNFLKTATLASGAVVFGVPTLLRGKNLNSKLNIAIIGAGGKGGGDADCCNGENIVALCDVDTENCAKTVQKYPNAKFYRDFRVMFDEMEKGIDAVDCATPDHFHAIAESHAMRLGKHVYGQKPLTQTIYEARYLRDLAHETGVVTQMGNQGSAADGLRRAVECIQAGIIGQVSEVHIWTNRPIWPQGIGRPEGSDPIPETLSWDTWIGPAPMRPYKKGVYDPFNWRGWLDFGTGALGDMACHTVNMTFRSLNLGYPTEVEATAIGGMNTETYPIGSKIRFQFPARKTRIPAMHKTFFHQHDTLEQSPVTLWWYDGGKPLSETPSSNDETNKPKSNHRGGHDASNKPPAELTADIAAMLGEIPGSGCLLVGEKGTIFSPDDYGEQFFVKLKGETKYTHFKKSPIVTAIPQFIPRNPFKGDNDLRQHLEWIAAIKEDKPEMCYSRFAVGAQLTEIMLLGCVSLRVGQKIEWDGPNMRATNCPAAAQFVKRDDRAGWKLS
ncbi:MAG TPA: Gfo/Idh/MocA family oxidoreductase [Verrucomicrobiae bacterium]|nr:Gfo/Idh/MocA family oxidoreductase [Verrucomicrobiae bacterium]